MVIPCRDIVYLPTYSSTYAMYLYMTPSLKEVQRNVQKKSYFILIIILRCIYIVIYKHCVFGLRKISTWNSVAIFFSFCEKERRKILALCLKSNNSIARIFNNTPSLLSSHAATINRNIHHSA